MEKGLRLRGVWDGMGSNLSHDMIQSIMSIVTTALLRGIKLYEMHLKLQQYESDATSSGTLLLFLFRFDP